MKKIRHRTVALLDLHIGRAVLQLCAFLFPAPRPIPAGAQLRSIIVLKLWGIGSILEATPFLRALMQFYPGAKIDIFTFSENQPIVEALNIFRRVHTVSLRGGTPPLFFQTMRFLLRQRGKYCLVIDLEFFSYFSTLVTRLLSSRYSLGFKGFYAARNRCYSRAVIFDHSSHVRSIFIKFLDALRMPEPSDLRLSIPQVPPEKKLGALRQFPSLSSPAPKVVVNINASELCLNRCWPQENFLTLVTYMQKDFRGLQIYLVGGKEDLPAVASFYSRLEKKDGVYLACGELDLLEFTHALSFMDFFITNDSGPLHIAEAIGIPVVCFFGPETPNLYGPLSQRSIIFYRNLFCSPCLNTFNQKRTSCRDNQCLKLISPDEVYARIKERMFIKNVPAVRKGEYPVDVKANS
jgi:ADP-heptose:LPS heptosyltransferase